MRSTGSRQQVEQQLRRLIETLRGQGVARLPTQRTLASKLHASAKLVHTICAKLRDEHVLYSVPRHGAFISGVNNPETAEITTDGTDTNRHGHKWRRLKQRIESDLATGTFSAGHGDTFNLQHVQLHYNSSYATARKAVRALIDDGTLGECRGGYRRSSHRVSPYSVTLVFVISEKALEHTWMANNAETLMHEFERACSLANIKLHLSFWRFYPPNSGQAIFPDFDSNQFSDSEMGRSIVGFVVYGNSHSPSSLDTLTTRLLPYRKPVAIIEERGGWITPEHFPGLPANFGWFDLRSAAVHGRILGQYLLEMGHRRAAYLSVYHGHPWSVSRYEGLCRAFASFGHNAGIPAFTISGRGPDRDAFVRCQADAFTRYLREVVHIEHLDSPSDPEQIFTLIHNVDIVSARAIEEAIMTVGTSLFTSCLEDKRVTAWVAANDLTMLGIRRFLRERGIDVPRQLSLVSFDNSRWAKRCRVTSYDFNVEELARAVLEFCLSLRRTRGRNAGANLRTIGGTVVERGSCRRRR